jgi:hypothetical protein
MAMIKSRLLNQRSLASTIIGVIPKEPEQHLDVSVSNKHLMQSENGRGAKCDKSMAGNDSCVI